MTMDLCLLGAEWTLTETDRARMSAYVRLQAFRIVGQKNVPPALHGGAKCPTEALTLSPMALGLDTRMIIYL